MLCVCCIWQTHFVFAFVVCWQQANKHFHSLAKCLFESSFRTKRAAYSCERLSATQLNLGVGSGTDDSSGFACDCCCPLLSFCFFTFNFWFNCRSRSHEHCWCLQGYTGSTYEYRTFTHSKLVLNRVIVYYFELHFIHPQFLESAADLLRYENQWKYFSPVSNASVCGGKTWETIFLAFTRSRPLWYTLNFVRIFAHSQLNNFPLMSMFWFCYAYSDQLKAFYVDLLVPLETNLEKDTKVVQVKQIKRNSLFAFFIFVLGNLIVNCLFMHLPRIRCRPFDPVRLAGWNSSSRRNSCSSIKCEPTATARRRRQWKNNGRRKTRPQMQIRRSK